jgi:hypothetical protein
MYNVELWNKASATHDVFEGSKYVAERRAAYAAYWQSGVLSSEFNAHRERYTAGHRNDMWEVILDPAYITSHRDMSPRRVITHAREDEKRQLMHKLFPKRACKGIYY